MLDISGSIPCQDGHKKTDAVVGDFLTKSVSAKVIREPAVSYSHTKNIAKNSVTSTYNVSTRWTHISSRMNNGAICCMSEKNVSFCKLNMTPSMI